MGDIPSFTKILANEDHQGSRLGGVVYLHGKVAQTTAVQHVILRCLEYWYNNTQCSSRQPWLQDAVFLVKMRNYFQKQVIWWVTM